MWKLVEEALGLGKASEQPSENPPAVRPHVTMMVLLDRDNAEKIDRGTPKSIIARSIFVPALGYRCDHLIVQEPTPGWLENNPDGFERWKRAIDEQWKCRLFIGGTITYI